MQWIISNRSNVSCRKIADRHYNRQKVGSPQFVPPGRCCVLYAKTKTGRALWVTSWPFAEYVKHEWAGGWVNSCFRNEGAGLSSELILQAVSASLWYYENTASWACDPMPDIGMITFIDPSVVPGFFTRGNNGRELMWGYSYLKAGFEYAGWSQGGKIALKMTPENMPSAIPPIGVNLDIFTNRVI